MGLTGKQIRGVSAADGTTKAKIERAALNLFAEHGIDGVSTKQIAARAGISEGAIYRHFAGKEDLARTLMKAIHNRLTDMIRAARSDSASLQSQVKFIVNHYCSIADDDWALFQYHILHLQHFPHLSDGPTESPIGAAAEILIPAMERKIIPKRDPHLLAAMALGVVTQAAQAKVFGYVSGPLSDQKETFSAAVFAVLSSRAET